jgi:hypothetical protein
VRGRTPKGTHAPFPFFSSCSGHRWPTLAVADDGRVCGAAACARRFSADIGRRAHRPPRAARRGANLLVRGMNIETKHILALVILLAFGSAGIFATLISQRLRDAALFFLVFGAVLMEKMDVTFLGQYWYRGTSRGIEVSALDIAPICLIFATLLLPRFRPRLFWPASFGLMLVFFGYCCVSVARSEPQLYGVWELTKMMRGMIVFLAAALFVRSRRELMIVVLAIGCAVCLQAGNAVEQRFLKGAFRPPGTMDHENTLSTYLCTVCPLLLAAAMSDWPKWFRWFAGISALLGAGAELLTLSRMGVPVFALVMTGTAVFCTRWEITRQKIAIVAAAFVCVCGLLAVSWDGLKARYASSNIEQEFTDTHAVETRGVYWRLAFTILEDHRYGVGLNNWSYYVSKQYGPELGYAYTDYDDIKWTPEKADARQIFLAPAADTLPALLLGELGIAGLVVFLLVWFRWFHMGLTFLKKRLNPDPMHRIGIGILFGTLGIFMQSATEWTYKQPPVMFTFHVMVGTLASLYYARRRAVVAAKQAVDDPVETEYEIDAVPLRVARVAK